jgi:hypothetical protein
VLVKAAREKPETAGEDLSVVRAMLVVYVGVLEAEWNHAGLDLVPSIETLGSLGKMQARAPRGLGSSGLYFQTHG